MKVAFFEVEDWEKEYVTTRIVSRKLPIDVSCSADPATEDASAALDIISVFVGSAITKEALEKFPGLKLLTTRSTGFDHIDTAAARDKGIAVGYVPGYGANTVAEFTFGLILTISRRIYDAADRVKERNEFSFEELQGFDLKGKTLGVVGTGRIGREVIRIARGFGMRVVGYDAFPNRELAKERNFSYVSLEELLAQSDIVTLHVPYSASTHHLINGSNIRAIKRGAVLINTARGGVLETDALVRALQDGTLAGAGLDVLEEEGAVSDEEIILATGHPEKHNLKTILENHILMKMPHVIITPHMAFNTKEAMMRILDTDIENIETFLKTGSPKHPVPSA